MAHDPHHDSIIESIKEIFARCSELEDRLEFLENELEAHASFDDCGDRREIANILGGYYSEFGDGATKESPSFICDGCGKHEVGGRSN